MQGSYTSITNRERKIMRLNNVNSYSTQNTPKKDKTAFGCKFCLQIAEKTGRTYESVYKEIMGNAIIHELTSHAPKSFRNLTGNEKDAVRIVAGLRHIETAKKELEKLNKIKVNWQFLKKLFSPKDKEIIFNYNI